MHIFPPPGLFCYRIHSDLLLLGGALSDGGSVIEWIRHLLNLQSEESFIACLEQVKALYNRKSFNPSYIGNIHSLKGTTEHENNIMIRTTTTPVIPTSLICVPFLGGERSTGFRNGATGSFLGLTRHTTQHDLVLSCMEGVILR